MIEGDHAIRTVEHVRRRQPALSLVDFCAQTLVLLLVDIRSVDPGKSDCGRVALIRRRLCRRAIKEHFVIVASFARCVVVREEVGIASAREEVSRDFRFADRRKPHPADRGEVRSGGGLIPGCQKRSGEELLILRWPQMQL